MHRPAIFWVNLAVKAALIGLLLFAVANPDMEQFQGKAMNARALFYPISAVIVPAVFWYLTRQRRVDIDYPFALDILVVLPLLIDTAGNALDLYDTIEWWDDFNHFLNWGILTLAFGQILLRLPLGRIAAAGLMMGFAALTAYVWEVLEYFTFVRNSPELATAYTDTLGDTGLALVGAALATVFVTRWQWPRYHDR
ncbi:MAG: hypothetical protein AB7V46_01085 [Thermomicrobiales bacterium]